MNRITAVVAGLLLAFVGTSESFADSNFHYVDLWGDDTNGHGTQGDPWRTIKHAISQCNNADYICLMDSYPDAYEEHNIKILDKKVYIQSCNGNREKVIIDGGGHARVFYINGSATNGTSIRDLTIKNGHTIGDAFNPQRNGGGIWCNSNVAVSNCKIMDCYAYSSGGGIYCVGSSPTITNCHITNNLANSDGWGPPGGFFGAGGGGIYCTDNSNANITGCTITNNKANNGSPVGGEYFGYGGGISCYDNSSPTITDCKISGNSANIHGGGISCNEYCSPTITECTISNNNASNDDGGGIYCFGNNSPTIASTVVCGNNPDQIHGGYTDAGGNTIQAECPVPGVCCTNGNCVTTEQGATPSECWKHFGDWYLGGDCNDCSPYLAGDLDGDGDVDADDLNALHDELGIETHRRQQQWLR